MIDVYVIVEKVWIQAGGSIVPEIAPLDDDSEHSDRSEKSVPATPPPPPSEDDAPSTPGPAPRSPNVKTDALIGWRIAIRMRDDIPTVPPLLPANLVVRNDDSFPAWFRTKRDPVYPHVVPDCSAKSRNCGYLLQCGFPETAIHCSRRVTQSNCDQGALSYFLRPSHSLSPLILTDSVKVKRVKTQSRFHTLLTPRVFKGN